MSVNDLTPNRALQQTIHETVGLRQVPEKQIDKGFIYVGFSEYDHEQKLVKRGDMGGLCDGTFYYYDVSHRALPSDGSFHSFQVKIGPGTRRIHHPAARFISGLVIVKFFEDL